MSRLLFVGLSLFGGCIELGVPPTVVDTDPATTGSALCLNGLEPASAVSAEFNNVRIAGITTFFEVDNTVLNGFSTACISPDGNEARVELLDSEGMSVGELYIKAPDGVGTFDPTADFASRQDVWLQTPDGEMHRFATTEWQRAQVDVVSVGNTFEVSCNGCTAIDNTSSSADDPGDGTTLNLTYTLTVTR